MPSILRTLFGTKNDRELKRILPLVQRVNALEKTVVGLSDEALRQRTTAFKERVANGEALDDLLPEAFATMREAAKRTLGQRHFDVQLVGGVVLHEGKIAEMKTGEGKTLVATLPAYLNALAGKGVHIVTVNDYLARRDSQWMGEVHRFLGLSVGVIVHDLSDAQRREAYGSDITYATNNELGFDYLRDNMKVALAHCVQRELHYAIVDEVDSILIDEARTPLIISGPSEDNTSLYGIANRAIPRLTAGTKGDHNKDIEETGDFWVDEKSHSATLTEEGIHKVEKMLGVENLYDPSMLPVLHAVHQALIAHTLKKLDVEYVVRATEGGKQEVVIVDEFTGRLMPGRRWSDGLHQAVEAKEGITVQNENQTLATVTFQNFFRMYNKVSGMTGTADTEAPEFAKIYDLDVLVIPSNRPMIRHDLADVVFKSKREKFDAVVDEIKARHTGSADPFDDKTSYVGGQPILVGTISIETSEMLSRKLSKFGIKHNVLNAKQHEREAEIVAQAGRKDAVTISTNMAGRGTDIVLGGNPEFLALAKCGHDKLHPDYPATLARFEAACASERAEVLSVGGLHIIGTERHESRRIDNQLRGRSGRQGDPGSSRFFLSLEDDLLRIFGSERITPWMERLGLEEGEAIEHRFVTRAIENAQKKVEARNFDSRKHLLDYDDVMNKQRQAFYGRRREALSRDEVHDEVLDMTEGAIVSLLAEHFPEKGVPEAEHVEGLATAIETLFGVKFDPRAPTFSEAVSGGDRDRLGHRVLDLLKGFLEEKERHWDEVADKYASLGYPRFRELEKGILLDTLDKQWKDHLLSMDGLREGIGLRGYAQKDPKVEYQREGYQLFAEMDDRVDALLLERVFKVVIREPQLEAAPRPAAAPEAARAPGLPQPSAVAAPAGSVLERRPALGAPRPPVTGSAPGAARTGPLPKVGRNDPCPCGSGQKYKKCHGAQ
jgi:preprotein translocase subunit SecA